MVVTRSRHGNETNQHDGQEAHHTAIFDEQNPEIQQRSGKQPMGHDDTGSSAPLSPNLNPDYLIVVELENMQLRSHLAKANKQIEEVLAWLPPLTTDVNVGKRQGGTRKSRRDSRPRLSRSVRTSTPSSTPMSPNHQEALFGGFPRDHQRTSKSVRTSMSSSASPSNAHDHPQRWSRTNLQR